MSEALLRELAEKIVQEQFMLHWKIYALTLFIGMVFTFGAAFFGAYAKKRGEALATKADFKNLLKEVKATTAATEEIKAKVSHEDWATRELKTLRRIKLEELLQAIYELQAWQDIERRSRIYNVKIDRGQSPLPKIQLLVALYFPELEDTLREFRQLHQKLRKEMLETEMSLLADGNDNTTETNVRQQFAKTWQELYLDQLKSIDEIERKSSEIMKELIGA